jgi:hypothetical protein
MREKGHLRASLPTYNALITGRPRKLRVLTMKFIHWQEGKLFLGYLLDCLDEGVQGEAFDDLRDSLIDLYRDPVGGELPGIRKPDELVIP